MCGENVVAFFSISLLISLFVAKNNHRTKYVHESDRTDFSRFDYLRLKTLTYARLLFFTGGRGGQLKTH